MQDLKTIWHQKRASHKLAIAALVLAALYLPYRFLWPDRDWKPLPYVWRVVPATHRLVS